MSDGAGARSTIHNIALWVGIAGGIAGVWTGYASIHGDLVKEQQQAVQAAANEAQQRQQRIDSLNQRLDMIDKHLRFIDDGLPKERQQIAQQVFAAMTAEVKRATEPHVFADQPSVQIEAMHEEGLPLHPERQAKKAAKKAPPKEPPQ